MDDGKTVLLVEAGIPAKKITSGYSSQFDRVCGCLITHEHTDHMKGAAGLAEFGVDLFASEKTLTILKPSVRRPYRLNVARPGIQRNIGSWIVLPWEAQHDAEEPLGYLLYSEETHEKLLFATDTYYIPNTFRRLNYIMVECNYSLDLLSGNVAEGNIPESHKERIMRSHFSLDNVKDFLSHNDLSQVYRIYLLHVSGQNGDRVMFKRAISRHTGLPVTVF